MSAFRSNNRNNSLIKVFIGLFVVSVIAMFVLLYVILSSKSGESNVKTIKVEEEKEPEVKMVSVLVPNRNIQPGVALEPSLFRIEQKAQVAVDNNAVTGVATINGKYAKSLIVAGVPLLKNLITEVKPVSAISSSIPPGYRAVTITVDKRASVEGWAKPGSKVDIVWASQIRGQPAITTIVQNAKILSTDQKTSDVNDGKKDPNVPSTVTVLVTVLDAQKIQLASTTGKLSLSLRGDLDLGSASNTSSITVDDLLGLSRGGPKRKLYKGKVTLGGKQWGLDEDGQLVPITED